MESLLQAQHLCGTNGGTITPTLRRPLTSLGIGLLIFPHTSPPFSKIPYLAANSHLPKRSWFLLAATPESSGSKYNQHSQAEEGLPLQNLARRFWKVALPYWYSDDKVQARSQLAAVFALTLATTGISVGFNFLGRDFFNALANKDQEQFTKQLFYYLVSFAGGIPVFVLRDYARETLALRWRTWMTSYYMERYLKDRTFYKMQSQSIIDNPDQRIVDDLSSFTGTALSFSLTLFNAAVDLISFSNILYGIYPPLFIVLLVYSIAGTAISIFLGKVSPSYHFIFFNAQAPPLVVILSLCFPSRLDKIFSW